MGTRSAIGLNGDLMIQPLFKHPSTTRWSKPDIAGIGLTFAAYMVWTDMNTNQASPTHFFMASSYPGAGQIFIPASNLQRIPPSTPAPVESGRPRPRWYLARKLHNVTVGHLEIPSPTPTHLEIEIPPVPSPVPSPCPPPFPT